MILFLSITISAQTTLEKEIEKIKSNPGVKLEYLDSNNLRIEYDKFTSRTYYLGSLEGTTKKLDSIPLFVFNLWQLDTALYNYKYQFWQEVPIVNYYIRPMIDDININGKLEYYGHKKDFFTENSEVYCYEQDNAGIFKQVFKYPHNTLLAYNIFDINRDGNLELHLFDTTIFRIDSINFGVLTNQAFFKKTNVNSLADSLYFKYKLYTLDNQNAQLDDFTFGDFDKDNINEAVFYNFNPREVRIVKYNSSIPTLDSIITFPITEYEDFGGFPIGDFDLDGKKDIIYAGAMGNINLIECEGIDNYSLNWTGNTGVPNSYINFKTNDIDGNGKPEFWIGGESFSNNASRLICYETIGDNSYHPVAEIEFPNLISLNPSGANAIDVDDDGTEEIYLKIGNTFVIIKFVGMVDDHNYEIYYYHKFENTVLSSRLIMFPNENYPTMILPMEFWQNGYGRKFTRMYKHYLTVNVDEQSNVVNNYNLFDCYPNPFNPSTNVRFSLAFSSNVKIKIYNSLGEEIITLLNQSLLAGEHNVVWNAVDKNNNLVPSGVYFITMLADPESAGETNRFIKTTKSVFIK